MQNRLWNDLRGFFESSKWDDAGKSFHAALKPTLNAVLIWEFRFLIILWEEAFGVWICFAQGILSSDSALPFPWLDENSNIIFTMYWIWQRWCLLLCISLVPYWVSCSGSNFYNFWFFILCVSELLFNHFCSSRNHWREARDFGDWIVCGGCSRGEYQGWDLLLRGSPDQVQP